MATKSIVGRFLVLAILVVCVGVVGQAGLIILQGGKKPVKTAVADPAVAAPAVAKTADAIDAPGGDPVRVVYPGPLGDAPAQKPKLADAAPASPLAAQQPTLRLAQAMADTAAPAPQATAATASPASAPQPDPSNLQSAPAAQLTTVSDLVTAADTAPAQPVSAPAATPAGNVQVASLGATAPSTDAAARHGVNINTASVAALNGLGGGHIGESIAKHRPYGSVEELVKKRVLRRSVYDQIKNEIATR